MARKIKLCFEGMMASPSELFPITAQVKNSKDKWLYEHKIQVGTLSTGDKRYVTKVTAKSELTGKDEPYYMDCITGTLYDMEGRCMSSEVLFLLNVADSPNAPRELYEKRMPCFIGEAYT